MENTGTITLPFYAFAAFFCAALVAAPQPPAKSTTDPLLRKSWMNEESQAAAGFLHRISSIIEKPRSHITIRDSAGRKFRLNMKGVISFHPFDDNWFSVLPRPEQAALHLAEADSLYRNGLRVEAFSIWKAIVAMSHGRKFSPEHVRRAAASAMQRINDVRNKNTKFDLLDHDSNPYAYYDAREDVTRIFSESPGFRLEFPGKWRFMRSTSRSQQRNHTELPYIVSYLRKDRMTVMLGYDAFTAAYRVDSLNGYSRLWDMRRSITTQRKRALQFRRQPLAQESIYCARGGRMDRFRNPHGRTYADLSREMLQRAGWRPACMLRRSRLAVRQAPPGRRLIRKFEKRKARRRVSVSMQLNFLEFIFLRPYSGMYLEIRHPQRMRKSAINLMRSILDRVHFSSR